MSGEKVYKYRKVVMAIISLFLFIGICMGFSILINGPHTPTGHNASARFARFVDQFEYGPYIIAIFLVLSLSTVLILYLKLLFSKHPANILCNEFIYFGGFLDRKYKIDEIEGYGVNEKPWFIVFFRIKNSNKKFLQPQIMPFFVKCSAKEILQDLESIPGLKRIK